MSSTVPSAKATRQFFHSNMSKNIVQSVLVCRMARPSVVPRLLRSGVRGRLEGYTALYRKHFVPRQMKILLLSEQSWQNYV